MLRRTLWVQLDAGAGCSVQKAALGQEDGAWCPHGAVEVLTGVGDSRSRTWSPRRGSGYSLRHWLLGAGHGAAVRLLLGLAALLTAPRGCLAA